MKPELKKQFIAWSEISDQVKNVNPKLHEILDECAPIIKAPLILAEYAYGDLIVKNGKFILDYFPKELQEQLNYNDVPLSLALKNSVDIYFENSKAVIPFSAHAQGTMAGKFASMHYFLDKKSNIYWSVSAGNRTCFMLPKISDSISLAKLRSTFQLSQEQIDIKTPSRHWNLFKALAQHMDQPWTCKILLFPKTWMEQIKTNKKCQAIKNIVYESAYAQMEFGLSKFQGDLLWQEFIDLLIRKNFKFKPYIAHYLKAITLVAMDEHPGFSCTQNEMYLPFKFLEQVFTDVYQLKSYHPHIMHTMPLKSISKGDIIYTSLRYLHLQQDPIDHIKNVSQDLELIQHLLYLLYEYIAKGNECNQQNLNKVRIDFIEIDAPKHTSFIDSTKVPETDPRFQVSLDQKFCDTGNFWKGALRFQSKA